MSDNGVAGSVLVPLEPSYQYSLEKRLWYVSDDPECKIQVTLLASMYRIRIHPSRVYTDRSKTSEPRGGVHVRYHPPSRIPPKATRNADQPPRVLRSCRSRIASYEGKHYAHHALKLSGQILS